MCLATGNIKANINTNSHLEQLRFRYRARGSLNGEVLVTVLHACSNRRVTFTNTSTKRDANDIKWKRSTIAAASFGTSSAFHMLKLRTLSFSHRWYRCSIILSPRERLNHRVKCFSRRETDLTNGRVNLVYSLRLTTIGLNGDLMIVRAYGNGREIFGLSFFSTYLMQAWINSRGSLWWDFGSSSVPLPSSLSTRVSRRADSAAATTCSDFDVNERKKSDTMCGLMLPTWDRLSASKKFVVDWRMIFLNRWIDATRSWTPSGSSSVTATQNDSTWMLKLLLENSDEEWIWWSVSGLDEDSWDVTNPSLSIRATLDIVSSISPSKEEMEEETNVTIKEVYEYQRQDIIYLQH